MLKLQETIKVFEDVKRRDPGQPEFHQAVVEVLESLEPVIKKRPDYVKGASSRGSSSPSA